jgi:hypothetical protein
MYACLPATRNDNEKDEQRNMYCVDVSMYHQFKFIDVCLCVCVIIYVSTHQTTSPQSATDHLELPRSCKTDSIAKNSVDQVQQCRAFRCDSTPRADIPPAHLQRLKTLAIPVSCFPTILSTVMCTFCIFLSKYSLPQFVSLSLYSNLYF